MKTKNVTKKQWINRLLKNPEIADRCDKWNEFDDIEWIELLSCQPQFADRCDKWSEFTPKQWYELLYKQPIEFQDKWEKYERWLEHKLVNYQISIENNTLEIKDTIVKHGIWKEITVEEWIYLLLINPKCQAQFLRDVSWEKLPNYEWIMLLSEHPQFADKCTKWDEFEIGEWENLLIYQPQFADRCNKWNEFDDENWNILMEEQPGCFIIKYNEYKLLNKKNI